VVHGGNRMVYRGTTKVLAGNIPVRERQEGRHGKVEPEKTLRVDCVVVPMNGVEYDVILPTWVATKLHQIPTRNVNPLVV